MGFHKQIYLTLRPHCVRACALEDEDYREVTVQMEEVCTEDMTGNIALVSYIRRRGSEGDRFPIVQRSGSLTAPRSYKSQPRACLSRAEQQHDGELASPS